MPYALATIFGLVLVFDIATKLRDVTLEVICLRLTLGENVFQSNR